MRKMNLTRKIRHSLPRINMIIGKRQIIVAGLTLLLGAAIYVNYIYTANRTGSNNLMAPIEDGQAAAEESGGSYYGDAAFVSGTSDVSEQIRAYFAQARLDLAQSRDEAKELLQVMYNGGDATGDELEVIARDANQLKNYIESETKIENLLKAQGFEEALCYLSDKGANIIVKTEGLDASGAAKIKNALLSEVSVASENITIVEIN